MDDTAPHIVTPSDNCSWQIKFFLINRLHSSKSVATLLVASCRQVLQRSHALRRGLSIHARGMCHYDTPPSHSTTDRLFHPIRILPGESLPTTATSRGWCGTLQRVAYGHREAIGSILVA